MEEKHKLPVDIRVREYMHRYLDSELTLANLGIVLVLVRMELKRELHVGFLDLHLHVYACMMIILYSNL